MINFKKTALAVVVLGVSGVASAAMYTPPPAPACQAVGVSVPCESSGWSAGVAGLYAKATSSGSNFAGGDNYQPTSDWAWVLNAGYNFGTGNDVNINWTRMRASDDALTPTNDSGGAAIDLENDFDAVNFEFGQHVDFGDNWNMRFHVGMQYMRLDQTSTNAQGLESTMNFNGWGPRAGVDVSYDFNNGVSLIANTAMTVLVGDSDREDSLTEGDTYTDREIVPGVDMKLGINLTHQMSSGDLGVQAGYQITNYWNHTTVNLLDDNWGFNGVYFGVNWSANA